MNRTASAPAGLRVGGAQRAPGGEGSEPSLPRLGQQRPSSGISSGASSAPPAVPDGPHTRPHGRTSRRPSCSSGVGSGSLSRVRRQALPCEGPPRPAGCDGEPRWSPRRRNEAIMARANDFICGLGAAGAAKTQPARPARDGRPTAPGLHGLSPAGRPAMSTAAREAEHLRQVARHLNVPLEIVTRAYGVFARHATAPEAEPKAPRPSLLQEGRLPKERFKKVVHDLLDCVSEDMVDVLADEAFRDADKEGRSEIHFGDVAVWVSSRSFSEVLNLTPEQIKMRDLARRHDISYAQVEQYRKCFDTFDCDGSGAIDRSEFEALLSKCARLPKGTTLPQQRTQTLWRLADLDGSRELDFQEFLVFYKRYFDGTGFQNMYRIGGNLPVLQRSSTSEGHTRCPSRA